MTEVVGAHLTRVRALMVTALPKEREAVLKYLDNYYELPRRPNGDVYIVGTVPLKGTLFPVAVVAAGKGNSEAAASTQRAIDFFSPEIAIFIGIAGSIKPDDIVIRDVIAGEKVYYCEATKQYKEHEGIRPNAWHADHALCERAKLEISKDKWKELIPKKYRNGSPKAIVGVIAATESVITSYESEDAKRIRTHYNDAQAVEMEGHGFEVVLHQNTPVRGIVVRGISDECERKSDDNQVEAVINAGAFAVNLLGYFDDLLGPAVDNISAVEDLFAKSGAPKGDAADSVAQASISRIEKQVGDGELRQAEGRLLALKEELWSQLSTVTKYQWGRVYSTVLRRTRRVTEGARVLVEFAEPLRNDPGALASLAYGYYLLGKASDGRAFAVEAIQADPECIQAWFAYVLTATDADTAMAALDDASRTVQTDSKVQVALAARFAEQKRWEKVEEHAREAGKHEHALNAFKFLGTAILQQMSPPIDEDGNVSLDSREKERVEEALEAFSEEIRRNKKFSDERDAVDSHIGRIRCYHLLAQEEKAKRELTIAENIAPDDPAVEFEKARQLSLQGKFAESAQIFSDLTAAAGESADATLELSLASQMIRSESVEMVDAGVARLQRLFTEHDDLDRVDYQAVLERLIKVYVARDQFDNAYQLIESANNQLLDAWFREGILGEVLRVEGRTDEAVSRIREACSLAKEDGSPADKSYLGRVAYSLGLWEETFALLSQTVREGELTLDLKRLLRAADELGKHEFYLEKAKLLREKSILDIGIIERELQLRSQVKQSEALEIAKATYEANPGNKLLFVLYAQQAGISGRLDEVEFEASSIPTVDTIRQRPHIAPLIVQLAVAAGKRELAITWSYSVYREMPDEGKAIEAFLSSMLGRRKGKLKVLEAPSKVGADSAVAYRIEGDANATWRIIESSYPVKPSLDEIAETDPVALAMSGKAVGDKFKHSGFMGGATAKIEEIKSKYVWRYQVLWREYPRRADQNFARPIKVLKGEGGDLDLEGLAKAFEARSEGLSAVSEAYSSGRAPINMLAEFAKVHPSELWVQLASSTQHLLPCWSGFISEASSKLLAHGSDLRLVVDDTALAALSVLGADEKLFPKATIFVVPHLLSDVQRLLESDVGEGRLSFADGKPVITETRETLEQYRRMIQSALQFVKEHAVVAEPDYVDNIGNTRFTDLAGIYGRTTAAILALCSQQGFALWTEDLFLGEHAQRELGVARVFSQALYERAAQMSSIGEAGAQDSVLRLLKAGCWTVAITAPTMKRYYQRYVRPEAMFDGMLCAYIRNPHITTYHAAFSLSSMLAGLALSGTDGGFEGRIAALLDATKERHDAKVVLATVLSVIDGMELTFERQVYYSIKAQITARLPDQNAMSDWSW